MGGDFIVSPHGVFPTEVEDKFQYINAILSRLHKHILFFGRFITISVPRAESRRKQKTHGWWLARVVRAASIRSVSFPSDCIPHLHPSPSYSGCSKRHEQTEWREREQGDNVFMDICFSEALQEAADRSSCLWLDLSSLGMAAVKKKNKKNKWFCFQHMRMPTIYHAHLKPYQEASDKQVWENLQLSSFHLFILLWPFLSLFVFLSICVYWYTYCEENGFNTEQRNWEHTVYLPKSV